MLLLATGNGSEKFISEIPGNMINLQDIQKATLWEQHIFYGKSYASSENEDR